MPSNLVPVLSASIAASLFLISALHLFWGLGGKWGAHATLPTTAEGTLIFRPGLPEYTMVAAGLAAMAWLLLAHAGVLPAILTPATSAKILLGVAVIFALRCVGDFRYFGIFRRVRNTGFGVMDRKFYTPLCAAYAAAFVLIALHR